MDLLPLSLLSDQVFEHRLILKQMHDRARIFITDKGKPAVTVTLENLRAELSRCYGIDELLCFVNTLVTKETWIPGILVKDYLTDDVLHPACPYRKWIELSTYVCTGDLQSVTELRYKVRSFLSVAKAGVQDLEML